ncbi:MAG TPA: UbiD family decarboxylase [Candidatus Binatia bacterium]|nr:UbiD family decarboxylase [Candidatus Binatia bacterium]
MKRKSTLADFLRHYRQQHPEDVFLVDEEVDVEYEPTVYYKLLEEKSPLIWFSKVKGYPDFQLVTNVMGSRSRMAFALGLDSESKLYETWNAVLNSKAEIRISDESAPVKERVSQGKDVDLYSLPVVKHYSGDGAHAGFGRYITSGLAVARDPLSPETINMSFTRMQIIDKDKYAFDMGSRSHFWRYVQSAKQAGKSLPISVVVGAHPLFYLLAASFIENEYSIAAKIIDATFTHGVTHDVPVPAEAEIVIEADVMPDEFYQEGPCAEFTGYMAARTTGNVASVKAILRKAKPIYYDIQPSNSNEHNSLFTTPRNAKINSLLAEVLPPGARYKIEWPLISASLLALCSLPNPEPGIAKQAGLALLALNALLSKIVMVNEGDCELELERFLANLSITGARNGENVHIITDVFAIKLDPTTTADGTNGKMIIVTKNSGLEYRKVIEKDAVKLVSGSSEVVFSHQRVNTCRVNIVVHRDIDLENTKQVVWALSTRLRPDKDVEFTEDGKITFDTTRMAEKLEAPKLPQDAIERVADRLRRAGL